MFDIKIFIVTKINSFRKKMKKTIKITMKQKEALKEMLFPNGSDNATPYKEYHNSQVVSDGYVDGVDGGGKPINKDGEYIEIGQMMAKNFPYGTGFYHAPMARPLGESTNNGEMSDLFNNDDSNGDGVPDKWNHADANYEKFGDFNEIPGTVKIWLEKLVNAMKQENLPPKKQIMVLNYVIDNANLNGIPFSYKKETIKKLGAKK